MTRDEAIAIYQKHSRKPGEVPGWLIDTLVELGVLHVETTENKVRIAAADRLIGMGVTTSLGAAALGRDGAFEILDIVALYEAAPYLVKMEPNVVALKAALRQLKPDQHLPGVKHWMEAKTHVR